VVSAYDFPLREDVDDLTFQVALKEKISKRLLGIRRLYTKKIMTFYFDSPLTDEEKKTLEGIVSSPPKLYTYDVAPKVEDVIKKVESIVGKRPKHVIVDGNNRPIKLVFDSEVPSDVIEAVKKAFYQL